MSDFLPSSAVDVVETKERIGDIVLTKKAIKTGLSNVLFNTIVCCLQHVEILTNSVSARHRAKCPIFGFFDKFGGRRRRKEKWYRLNFFSVISIRTGFSSGLFTTINCCLQHVKILTNSVSARHRGKCPIFGLSAKFGGQPRGKEKRYLPN